MQFTKVPSDAFETLQMNAGIIATGFVPATGVVTGQLGATSGGIQFATNPEFEDIGEDVDNAPPNTKQLKRLKWYDPTASGTFVNMSKTLAKALNAAGAYDGTDTTKFVPTHELDLESDFSDIWIIGDYTNKNKGAATAGCIAIHMKDALNTTGFQWQSTKDGKGQFAFEYHAHYDLDDPDAVPFEFYIKAGTEPTP